MRLITNAPRWLFLATLVYAPWAYGCTRPWTSQLLAILLCATTVLWLFECLLRRRTPQIPLLLLICVGGLLMQGWWMACNAKSTFDPETLVFTPKGSLLSARPGSIDEKLSFAAMLLCTGLAGTLLFVVDLSTRPIWRKRIWITMAAAGASIALFGIVQKIGGEGVLAWTFEKAKIDANNNFAMYRYRGNAGAFLNLVVPILAALAVEAFRRRSALGRGLWVSALIIGVAGVQLNPSRASWMICLALALASAAFWVWRKFRTSGFDKIDLWRYGTVAGLLAAALALICYWGNWQSSMFRIGKQGLSTADRSPTEIYVAMLPDAGMLGFGPGTFRAAFPGYQLTHDFGSRKVPEFWTTHSWLHAHEDYLQTLIEWGYLGGALWSIVLLGGLWRGLRLVRATLNSEGHHSRGSSPAHALFIACSLLALVGVLLHSLVDFPLQIASIQLYVATLLAICWKMPEGESAIEAKT